MCDFARVDNVVANYWQRNHGTAMSASSFDWETVAVVGIAILVAKMVPRLSGIPWFLKWIHFGLVGIFSLIAIRGPHFGLLFCLQHRRFVELFSQPNVLGVGPILMEYLALIFALAGTVFYVAVMMLGNFRRRARIVFMYLVFPCAILHPIIMSTAFGVSGIPSAVLITSTIALALIALGCFAIAFYNSKVISSTIPFK